jgi:hypothetical protein
MLLYFFLKQYITIPRFGYVQFAPKQKVLRQSWVVLGIGVLVLFAFLIGAIFKINNPSFPEMQAWMQQYHMIPLSAMLFGLPALAAAIFLGLKRFYLYAVLAVGLPALGAWLNIETFIPILATGIVMLAFGTALLSSFLKKYQVGDKAGGNVSG